MVKSGEETGQQGRCSFKSQDGREGMGNSRLVVNKVMNKDVSRLLFYQYVIRN